MFSEFPKEPIMTVRFAGVHLGAPSVGRLAACRTGEHVRNDRKYVAPVICP